jgi:hypothetical protein
MTLRRSEFLVFAGLMSGLMAIALPVRAEDQAQAENNSSAAVEKEAQNSPPSVGQAPESSSRPPAVAQIFDQPGILTPRGSFAIEPSLQYSYASNNRVTLVGYTVIPAILIGLIDIRSVNRSTVIAALTARYGVSNRFELEGKVPYVYRNDSTVTRAFGSGANQDSASSTSGSGIGDVEFTARWQMNDGGAETPFYISYLRVKTRSGESPFEVELDANNLQKTLPTGSGFYGIQPGLTAIFPSDPAAFFGGVSYQFNLARNAGENYGSVDPGDVFGINFGMGVALNEKASFSLGYDHSVIGRDEINGATAHSATVVQLGSLLLGYTYRLSDKRSFNVSLSAGLTEDSPDMQLTLRWPMNF